jgi:hypothetical protein
LILGEFQREGVEFLNRALPVHRADGERTPSFTERSADRANAEANLRNIRFVLARRDFSP